MHTPDKDWWTAQAGEYVLGTLSYADRLVFQKALAHNKDAEKLVAQWEQVFQPLADSLTPKQPAQRVWDGVYHRLFGEMVRDANAFRPIEKTNTLGTLERKVSRWRSVASFATAACVVLATLLWVNYRDDAPSAPSETDAPLAQVNAISIIRDDNSLPLWVVNAAVENGFVQVTSLAPPAIGDANSYQLWAIKPDQAGVYSMGLIPENGEISVLLNFAPLPERPAAFAVSLEPLGGSTEEGPSGPVLYQGELNPLNQ